MSPHPLWVLRQQMCSSFSFLFDVFRLCPHFECVVVCGFIFSSWVDLCKCPHCQEKEIWHQHSSSFFFNLWVAFNAVTVPQYVQTFTCWRTGAVSGGSRTHIATTCIWMCGHNFYSDRQALSVVFWIVW